MQHCSHWHCSHCLHSRQKAKTSVVNNETVKIALDSAGELWLLNASNDNVTLGPCELFGFNVGSFQEKKTGWQGEPSLGQAFHWLPGSELSGSQFAIKYYYYYRFFIHWTHNTLLLTGLAKSAKDKSIAFLLEKDTDLLVQVSGQSKKLSCLADLACQAAQNSGVTEMSLEDHTVTQVVKDRL